jgi:adenine/guanine phosphoribosyltransferase-like PRPP-binding protein
VSGNIRVTASGGGTSTHYCEAGTPLLVIVDRVLATGTTATGIVALYQS